MIRKIFVLLINFVFLIMFTTICYTEVSADQAVHEVTSERSEQNCLPPFIDVTDYGNVSRKQFPVTGSIPLPKGALTEKTLSSLALFSTDKQQVPAQFSVIGRWLNGSVKWLLLDFQSTQDAGSTARYTLQVGGETLKELNLLSDGYFVNRLASKKPSGIEVNTGKLKAVFGGRNVTFSLHSNGDWQKVVDGNLVSRIGVRRRGTGAVIQYTLNTNATIETNGPMRAVVKEELTYPEYRTTTLRTFYEMCEEEALRRKIGEIFLASYATYRQKRGHLGSLEMAAFAYEISPSREAAERLEKVAEDWSRLISCQLGWLDNMVLRGMNDLAKMNAVCYSLYWLQEMNKGWVEPVSIRPDGGTFEKPVEVTLTCQTKDATIRYTLDRSELTERSLEYQKSFTVHLGTKWRGEAAFQSCTIKAKAFKQSLKSKPATNATFAN